ncbi:MAG TPA: type IV pili twitching motility protein PilT [Bdellovibrionales bacterium]|nr:MAG: type IV pili twitching motility protein PilT [Bdellovibrionales bacterium GWB1_52_6]OFZ06373.1 MAG: type IV pili twitching motility protein PilT [Bdellovibrionales bacterium GWA1_52_35]OFZ39978.1 MAG: type IV pili twitching motility protein PilT [Bdellovibrionales bacterium GWC1_52_8]HAR42846.1 type IV pili twitching motility protein PilT [Bdellovibrionales bacterium]HCM40126.1 type IV pili twitching motility protein PilT [Bdellovibrionales bacterium]
MAKIDQLFDLMIAHQASDLHLVQGQRPKLRQHGSIIPLSEEPLLDEARIRTFLQEICNPTRWANFLKTKDLDFAYEKDATMRFRCNYYWQIHGMAAVFRIIPTKILTVEELHLPKVIKNFAHFRSGLVLVTGPTGSGKSTTLAAVINHINERYRRYILTIEEPIEFVHKNKMSSFCQREVGSDVNTFADGLRSAARQDCDVILVGEMRDLETISLALTAASKGVLVFGTLHTNSAVKTVDRIIDVFPAPLQGMARSMLADSLRGICAQLLMKKKSGGRVAVNEILLEGPGMGPSIREGNISNLYNIISAGQSRGMKLMDDALLEQVAQGNADVEEAYLLAESKEGFRDKVRSVIPIQPSAQPLPSSSPQRT